MFDGVLKVRRKNRTNRVFRECIEARFTDMDTGQTTHLSYHPEGTRLVVSTFAGHSVLKRTPKGWKIAESRYAVEEKTELSAVLSGRFEKLKETQDG